MYSVYNHATAKVQPFCKRRLSFCFVKSSWDRDRRDPVQDVSMRFGDYVENYVNTILLFGKVA